MSLDAMKQALEALELLARYENPETKIQVRKPRDGGPIVTMYPHKVASEAAAALRAAIEQAQPEQEPFCYHDGRNIVGKEYADHSDVFPLYTAPRQWQGLTDEEIDALEIDENGLPNSQLEFAWAIEAKLKEKNHG